MKFTRRRWSDRDSYWGPFTFARPDRHYRPTGVMLASHGEDDLAGSWLRLALFGWVLIVSLPGWLLRPKRQWKEITHEPMRSQMLEQGRPAGYWEIWTREYGFSIIEGALHYHYGEQTHTWPGTKSGCWTFPWRAWRHVRRSLYRPDGRLFADLPEHSRRMVMEERTLRWEEEREIEGRCPTVSFAFLDYDGEPITAKCRIEEREWRLGEGKFKWLSLFRRPRIEQSLCLEFSSETGNRKGSWKGGTIGTGITMKPGEDAAEAFQRYCDGNGMKFAREPHLFERYGLTEKPKGWNAEVMGHFFRSPELREPDASFKAAFAERADEAKPV